MAREEQIKEAKQSFYERILDEDAYYDPRDCFEEGVAWADDNPKCKWISVEDDLPYKHKELLGKDGDYTKEVLVAVIDIENNKILYTVTIMADLGRRGHYHKWEWLFKSEVFKITHWMPIPKLEEDEL